MEIQEKLLKFKFHIIFALIISVSVFSIVILAPSFLTILAYFWPLFLSTALFLVAVIFFGKISVAGSDGHGDNKAAAEGLLDYVAGQPSQEHIQLDAPQPPLVVDDPSPPSKSDE